MRVNQCLIQRSAMSVQQIEQVKKLNTDHLFKNEKAKHGKPIQHSGKYQRKII